MKVEQNRNDVFKQTELGPLPAHWELAKLGVLFDLEQGKAVNAKRMNETPQYPFLRTSNVLWGQLDLATVDRMYFSDKEIERLRLRPRDLLVCEGGEVGRTAIWSGEMDVCAHQNHLHRMRAKEDDVWPEFYMYWMRGAMILMGLYGGEGIKTTIPNLSKGRLQSLTVPKPPLEEQRKIAVILDTIHKAIDVTERKNRALNRLSKSMLLNLMTGEVHVRELNLGGLGVS